MTVHAVKIARRWRLAWAGTRKVARRADGSAFDGGGWLEGQPCTAGLAARAINANLVKRSLVPCQ
jgi:hypothetical protein